MSASEPPTLAGLSDDAKCVLGGTFGFGNTELTFHMRESRPSLRAQAALDELVSKNALWRETINGGGVRYKPLTSLGREAFKWFGKNLAKGEWSMTEPVT